MKVIIAGGRDFVPTDEDYDLLYSLHKEYGFTQIVSGLAYGADSFGEVWAEENWLNYKAENRIKKFPAKWNDLDVENCVVKTNRVGNKYNALAGFNRNEEMSCYADAVILFKGGKGTDDMRKRAIAHGLEILYDEQ